MHTLIVPCSLFRLDEALASLDTYKSEVSHFTWEGFLGLLGDALDGAVYEKGAAV